MHESTVLTLIFTGEELIHSDASASAVQSSESAICTHITPFLGFLPIYVAMEH